MSSQIRDHHGITFAGVICMRQPDGFLGCCCGRLRALRANAASSLGQPIAKRISIQPWDLDLTPPYSLGFQLRSVGRHICALLSLILINCWSDLHEIYTKFVNIHGSRPSSQTFCSTELVLELMFISFSIILQGWQICVNLCRSERGPDFWVNKLSTICSVQNTLSTVLLCWVNCCKSQIDKRQKKTHICKLMCTQAHE